MDQPFSWAVLLPAGLFFIVGAVLALACGKLVAPLVARAARRLNRPVLAEGAEAFLRPAGYAILAMGLYGAVQLVPESLRSQPWMPVIEHLCAAGCIACFAWGLVRAGRVVPMLILGVGTRLDLGTGKALANFVMRIYQALVIFIAAATVLAVFGLNVNGVLTGLGLGGLSFALAGQDLASNLFGGIVLITERPFEIGDWVSTADAEGSVEDISLRSTRIRTLDGTVVTVPNQKFTTAAITNWNRMDRRLAKFTLGLCYDTAPDTLQAVIGDLRDMLKSHSHVDADSVQVWLDAFGASSLDVTVQFYVKDTAIGDYRAVRQDINFRILEILSRHNASLAYPSRSIYLAGSTAAPKEGTL